MESNDLFLYIYYLSYLTALVFAGLAVAAYAAMLHEYEDNEYICAMLSFLAVLNLFSIEYFLFIEKGLFMIAIFSNVLAVYFMRKYFCDNNL